MTDIGTLFEDKTHHLGIIAHLIINDDAQFHLSGFQNWQNL
jgi:hypothetical protein